MVKRLAITLGALVLGTFIVAGATPAYAAVTPSLNATIALSNCSASLVRFPSSLDTDRAMMLTNGHCYEGGMPSAGQVLQNRSSTRSGTLLDANGNNLGTVRADLLIYATMTGNDVSLYRLNTTFTSIRTSFGVTALTISDTHPVAGSTMFIPSGYWKRVWNCSINSFVGTLREDQWTWRDSIRYSNGCDTIHGTSGSPVVDVASGRQVGINNTGNDDGAMCTLNNPCEVNPDGTTTAVQGRTYGQETYWFTTCLTASNTIDLSISGCLLTKPPGSGNTVTVTNPGSRSSTQNVATSLQIQASDSQPGQTLTYSATGLPTGLTINSSTGLISGTPTTTGSYNVTVTARDTTNASGSASFSWTISAVGACNSPATNGADVQIPDNTTVFSNVAISGCPGNASTTSTVEVHIVHTYRGDLVVALVAPDGTAYTLLNRSGGSADNVDQTFTVNLSSEVKNGTWRLRVQDAASADTGYINTWTLKL